MEEIIPVISKVIDPYITENDQQIPVCELIADRLQHQIFKIRMLVTGQIDVIEIFVKLRQASVP